MTERIASGAQWLTGTNEIKTNENAGSGQPCKYDFSRSVKPEEKKPERITFFLLISALMGDPKAGCCQPALVKGFGR